MVGVSGSHHLIHHAESALRVNTLQLSPDDLNAEFSGKSVVLTEYLDSEVIAALLEAAPGGNLTKGQAKARGRGRMVSA